MKDQYDYLFKDIRAKESELSGLEGSEAVTKFVKYVHTDPLVLLANIEAQAREHLDNGLEEYLVPAVKKILEDVIEARTAFEQGQLAFFGWKMFFIGQSFAMLNHQEFLQDGGRAINMRLKQDKGINRLNQKRDERKKLIEARDDINVSECEGISARASAIKMQQFIKTFDRENGLTYSQETQEAYIDPIKRHISAYREK